MLLIFLHTSQISQKKKITNFIKTSGTLNSITKPSSVQKYTRIKIFQTFADVHNIAECQTMIGHSSPAAYSDVFSRYKLLGSGTHLGVDGWIILGWISRRWDVGIWTGLGWPTIETVGGRL